MSRPLHAVLCQAAAVLWRLVRRAPVAAALILAALCVDASVFENPLDWLSDSESAPGAEDDESDLSESSDALDEVTAHAQVVIAPPGAGEIERFAAIERGRSGFRSRVPRPSGR